MLKSKIGKTLCILSSIASLLRLFEEYRAVTIAASHIASASDIDIDIAGIIFFRMVLDFSTLDFNWFPSVSDF